MYKTNTIVVFSRMIWEIEIAGNSDHYSGVNILTPSSYDA